MPLYDFLCFKCGAREVDRFESFRTKTITCRRCYSDMVRLTPSSVSFNMGVGAYGYYDDNLGQYVGTNREKREVMLKQGVTPKGDTPKQGVAWV